MHTPVRQLSLCVRAVIAARCHWPVTRSDLGDRVAGLKQQIEAGVHEISPDGLTPSAQLVAIRDAASRIIERSRRCLIEDLLLALQKAGIHLLDYKELNQNQKSEVDRYFGEVVFPVLTPLAFDAGRPFPHISNLSLNLAILIRDKDGEEHFARVKCSRDVASVNSRPSQPGWQ